MSQIVQISRWQIQIRVPLDDICVILFSLVKTGDANFSSAVWDVFLKGKINKKSWMPAGNEQQKQIPITTLSFGFVSLTSREIFSASCGVGLGQFAPNLPDCQSKVAEIRLLPDWWNAWVFCKQAGPGHWWQRLPVPAVCLCMEDGTQNFHHFVTSENIQLNSTRQKQWETYTLLEENPATLRLSLKGLKNGVSITEIVSRPSSEATTASWNITRPFSQTSKTWLYSYYSWLQGDARVLSFAKYHETSHHGHSVIRPSLPHCLTHQAQLLVHLGNGKNGTWTGHSSCGSAQEYIA